MESVIIVPAVFRAISFKSPNVHALFVKLHVLFVKVHINSYKSAYTFRTFETDSTPYGRRDGRSKRTVGLTLLPTCNVMYIHPESDLNIMSSVHQSCVSYLHTVWS